MPKSSSKPQHVSLFLFFRCLSLPKGKMPSETTEIFIEFLNIISFHCFRAILVSFCLRFRFQKQKNTFLSLPLVLFVGFPPKKLNLPSCFPPHHGFRCQNLLRRRTAHAVSNAFSLHRVGKSQKIERKSHD